MIILLDLNRPLETMDDMLWCDTPMDTVMLIAARRNAAPIRDDVALAAGVPDDITAATWEDAEWQ